MLLSGSEQSLLASRLQRRVLLIGDRLGSLWRGKMTASDRLHRSDSSIFQRIDGIPGWIVLHGNELIVAKIRELTINSRVVYLACTGFMPSRDIRDVDKTNFIDVIDEFLNQITEPALLMIEVIKDLHIRPANLPNDLESVDYGLKKDRGILERINRFNYDLNMIVRGEICSAL